METTLPPPNKKIKFTLLLIINFTNSYNTHLTGQILGGLTIKLSLFSVMWIRWLKYATKPQINLMLINVRKTYDAFIHFTVWTTRNETQRPL